MSAYAVVKTGGKQYKVAVGDVVEVEKLDGEPGTEHTL
ncbi:bL21 family ribosomal protein, partial [Saccharomonospora azurea]